MIRKMLIANRGEIAVRVIRACREMDIETVAVYSTADKECLHVQLADHAVCIGPAPSAKSYLNKEALITAALCTSCDAVHPGVGFLSENADFAREVEKSGMFWIGPKPDTIEMLGDKVKARETAQKSGLPITPGSTGAIKTKEQAVETANKCGYPVIIKAASGGGGKGMRIVWKEADLADNLAIASSEAEANFADGTVYIEKYLTDPRHVELQVIGDGAGGVAILGERDCSVQRNHQKLIEESPSQAVSDAMYDTMCAGAKKLFSTLNYCGAGTIEFLVSGDQFYFMEVNARTPGLITNLRIPGGNGIRFDGFLYQGYKVVPFYDSMTAKLIAHGENRMQTIKKLLCALDELHIEGIQTNIEEQKTILRSAQFQSGNFGTSLYAQLFEEKK